MRSDCGGQGCPSWQWVGEHTKNSINKIAAVAISLFLLCCGTSFLSAQDAGKNDGADKSITSNESTQNTPVTENTVVDTGKADQISENTIIKSTSGGNGVWVFFKMILVLAIIIALIWLVFRFLKKSTQPGGKDDPFMRKVSSIALGPGKTVQIVTLIDKAFLIGVSDNGVNLISEIDDKELIDAMNLYADKNANTKKSRSFADVLDIFMPNGPRNKSASKNKKETIYDGSAEQVVNMLKKQRDRLNKEDKE